MKSPFGYFGAGILIIIKSNFQLQALFVYNADKNKIEAPGGKWETIDGEGLDFNIKQNINLSLARCAVREVSEETGLLVNIDSLLFCPYIDLHTKGVPNYRLYFHMITDLNQLNIVANNEYWLTIKYVHLRKIKKLIKQIKYSNARKKLYTLHDNIDDIYQIANRFLLLMSESKAARVINELLRYE